VFEKKSFTSARILTFAFIQNFAGIGGNHAGTFTSTGVNPIAFDPFSNSITI
jgi:hypothetical protein